MHREINTCNFLAHPFPRDSCALVHTQKSNYHTLCPHSRTAASCVRAQKAVASPQFRFIVSFRATASHRTASCCWKNGCKFGQIDDIRLSGFRSCSLPDFNTACDLRKHKSLFRGAPYDVPKQGYLRRQTTDYRRLARIQGSFSNKHPLAHSPRKATSNFDPKIQHHVRKNPFLWRSAPCKFSFAQNDDRAQPTCTAPTRALRRSARQHTPAPAPLALPPHPRRLAPTHRALALHVTHHPLPAHRPHPRQRATTRTPPARYATAHSSPRPRFPSERHSQHPRAAAPCSRLVRPLVRIARLLPDPFPTLHGRKRGCA